MRKLLLMAAAFTLAGCASTGTANLTPCEKALLAKYAADKLLDYVCPIDPTDLEES